MKQQTLAAVSWFEKYGRGTRKAEFLVPTARSDWFTVPASRRPTFMIATKYRTCCMAMRPAFMATAPTSIVRWQRATKTPIGASPVCAPRSSTHFHLEAPAGLCQGPLPRLGKECESGVYQAGDDQHQQVGTTDVSGASYMRPMYCMVLHFGTKTLIDPIE